MPHWLHDPVGMTGITAPSPEFIDCGSFILRAPRVGDMGWIVHRQALIYARDYGWDASFEGLIAGIASRFVEEFDPAGERCFVAQRDGAVIGSAFLVRDKTASSGPATAKIRLVYVEAEARGLGVGRRMVAECIAFARQVGYGKVTLWTNDILVSARRIYEAEGFTLVRAEPHHSFGQDLVGQYWELTL